MTKIQLIASLGLAGFIMTRPPVVALPWLIGALIVVILGKVSRKV